MPAPSRIEKLREEFATLPKADKSLFSKAKNKEGKKLCVLKAWFSNVLLPELHPPASKCQAGTMPPKPAKKAATSAASGKLDPSETKPGAAQKDSLPAKPAKGSSKTKSEEEAVADSKGLFEVLLGQEPDILPGTIQEEPKPLDKILLFSGTWLEAILKGEKTLELRKTRVTCKDGSEVMYLAVGATILGLCRLSAPLRIDSMEMFQKLKMKHQWSQPDPPYSFPFVGHGVSEVQRLTPLQFLKLQGCQGRSLYRKLEAPAPADSEGAKEAQTLDEPPEESKAKKGPKKKAAKANPAAKEAAKKTAPPADEVQDEAPEDSAEPPKKKPKVKKRGINLLPTAALQSAEVKEIDPKSHFQPSTERLEGKYKLLKSKCAKVKMHISGGCLAHFNNVGFPRAPCTTAAILLGEQKKSIVYASGLWVPAWEDQANMESWELSGEDFQEFCTKKEVTAVAMCLITPEDDAPDPSKLMVFDKLRQKCPSMLFALTCSDKKSTFYEYKEEGVNPVPIEVNRFGKQML